MATLDSILDQIVKSDLDILGLLKIRSTVEDRLTVRERELRKQLAAVEGAMGGVETDEPRPAVRRRGRKAATSAVTRSKPGRRGRKGKGRVSRGAGKNTGMSVSEAVTALLKGKGGRLSAADIKKHFAAAGDRRNLNFTLLTRTGIVKRTGFEAKKEGKKGRAGGIYSLV